MKKKTGRGLILTLISMILIVGIVVGYTYVAVDKLRMPIDLPMKAQTVLYGSDISDVQFIIDSWADKKIYEVKVVLPDPTPIPDPEPELNTKFDHLIVKESLINYINGHTSVINRGSEFLFIDEVTTENIGIGIKTIGNDDVVGFDNYDGVMLASNILDSGARIKIGFISPETNIDLNTVKNLSIWEEMYKHGEKTNAILAINGSDYTWNNAYEFGSLDGLLKTHGSIVRKVDKENLTVGFNAYNEFIIGKSTEMYNGIEGTKILIKGGIPQIDGFEEYISNGDITPLEVVIKTPEDNNNTDSNIVVTAPESTEAVDTNETTVDVNNEITIEVPTLTPEEIEEQENLGITEDIEGTININPDYSDYDYLKEFKSAKDTSEEKRQGKTAIGILEDGTIITIVAEDSKTYGATETEIVELLLKYKTVDAIMLGCGSRSLMYWNGRVVNKSSSGHGIKIPNVWYVKSVYAEAQSKEDITDSEDTKDVLEDILNSVN